MGTVTMPARRTRQEPTTTATVGRSPTDRLVAADERAARAARRVRTLQARAWAGASYDPDDFDAAIVAQRQAQAEAAAARAAWVRWRQAQGRREPASHAA
jgi:hypothetical protein